MWRAFSGLWAPKIPFALPAFSKQREFVHKGQPFLLRLATREDVGALVLLEKAVYDGQTPWREADFRREIEAMATRLYLVLVHDEQIVAFIGTMYWRDRHDLHVANIAVSPAWQSFGLGSFLFAEVETYAREVGVASMSLEVRRSNVGAQRLYERLGFVVTGVKAHYYHGDHEDALDMKKEF